jgi:hypothetical protein
VRPWCVAKIRTYNPPPNWPAPPPGWTPPPGWQPDPSWGPAPEAWPVWIERRANPFSCMFALAASAVLLVGLLAIGTVAMRSAPSEEAFETILGRCIFTAVITAAIAYFWSTRWRWWTYLLAGLAVYAGLTFLTTGMGQQTAGR